MNKNYNFTKKIECIYKNIAKSNIYTLVELFKNNTNNKHRTIHIQNKWLKNAGKDYKPRTFKKEFESYPFYKTITLNNKPLFKTADEFLEISLEDFCQKINSYTNSINQFSNLQTKLNFEYFLYYSQESRNEFGIKQLQIVYKNFTSLSKKDIELYDLEKNTNIPLYSGKIYLKEQKLILEFNNQDDQIMAIFNMEMLNQKSNELVGVAIGISDINQKIPVAKKVILIKNKPTKSDLSKLYLTLNQTEIIFAEENSYNFEVEKSDILHKHFNKYFNKFTKFNTFFTTLIQNDLNFIKYRLLKEQLHSTVKIFEKVKNNQEFYISSFYKGFKSILLSFKQETYVKLFIVIPIYNKDFIFNYFSKEARESLAHIKEIVKYSLELEIVFIIDNCYDSFSIEFNNHLEILQDIAKVFFLHKNEIDTNFTTNEFIYSNKRNFIFYKPKRSFRNIYKYSTDKELIDYIESFYYKLRYKAVPIKKFLKSKRICFKDKTIYNSWYLYLQGTKQLWQMKLTIFSDNNVTISYRDKITDKGHLIKNAEQSIIITQDIENKKSMTMFFDNKNVLQNIFLVYVTAKAYMKEDIVFTIAIASKVELEINDVRKILKKDNLSYGNIGIEDRLSNYVFHKNEKNN